MTKEENYLAMFAPSVAEAVLGPIGVNESFLCKYCGIKCHAGDGIATMSLRVSGLITMWRGGGVEREDESVERGHSRLPTPGLVPSTFGEGSGLPGDRTHRLQIRRVATAKGIRFLTISIILSVVRFACERRVDILAGRWRSR